MVREKNLQTKKRKTANTSYKVVPTLLWAADEMSRIDILEKGDLDDAGI